MASDRSVRQIVAAEMNATTPRPINSRASSEQLHRDKGTPLVAGNSQANGTRVVKFYLHLSKEEQRKRFLARIDAPEKNWKFSLADIEERKFWKQYMTAYEACLSATSTSVANGETSPAARAAIAGW